LFEFDRVEMKSDFWASQGRRAEYCPAEMSGSAYGSARGFSARVVILLAVVCASGGRAAATESDDLIKKGVEQRRKGEDDKALELFKRAHDIDQGARSEAQMGFAEQALGIWALAETHLTEALAQANDPWIKKNNAALRKALDTVASHLGTLEVWGSPAGAEVVMGGTTVGVLPQPVRVRVTAGTVQITVHADGFVELARVVEVPPGGKVRERFELPRKRTPALAPARALSLAPEPEPDAARTARPSLVQLQSAPVEPAETSTSVWRTWWL
jgi:tetratricopeptide (TPR) repeat protein